jgi:hypothetical protein
VICGVSPDGVAENGTRSGKLLVVESQQVQDCGVEVVNVDSIVADGDAEFVSGAGAETSELSYDDCRPCRG